MNQYAFVTTIPIQTGGLQRGVTIITDHNGNINRIHFDRGIDPHTAFFEVTATPEEYEKIRQGLADIGYLQTSLETFASLKIHIHLPHESGALNDFLTMTTGAGAQITSITFDDAGIHPDRVTISMNVRESNPAEELLDALKSRYPIEVLEFDKTGKSLDDTVFYLRFAQKMRTLIDTRDDDFLLRFLGDINHTAQDLTARGEDPKTVFRNVLEAGEYIAATCGDGFYADVQILTLSEEVTLYAIQLPSGGNIYLFRALDGFQMLDTGYAVYNPDVMQLFATYGLPVAEELTRIITSHGDADHCGAGGFFDVPTLMHPATQEIIRTGNRAWGSRNEGMVLEEIYTTMIALYSRWNPPAEKNIHLIKPETEEKRSIFPVICRLTIGDLVFEVLETPGGHQVGELVLYCPEEGYLFTSDSLMNFSSLTEERRRYNSYADYLVTSVNVDSDLARAERRALSWIAQEFTEKTGKVCTIFGGHGAVSEYRDGTLTVKGTIEHYTHARGRVIPEERA
ncbi:MBL fold metallo-hydrolase [Methanogenium marinum]|uniref:MBL fold metallo-hydrolase n=1 Tax=Methanogenium marinum TaxID=348610 RepID=A0A9Q4PYR7_9EURY|nr:MBL fold metallo-hydrolase [Methanogenium marinum]MDE4908502.1 MBL fold metallo-hydrolase [Methanogenium marinum]